LLDTLPHQQGEFWVEEEKISLTSVEVKMEQSLPPCLSEIRVFYFLFFHSEIFLHKSKLLHKCCRSIDETDSSITRHSLFSYAGLAFPSLETIKCLLRVVSSTNVFFFGGARN